ITPEAASKPKAEPPASITAWTFPTRLMGLSKSVSRVPGAPPRTSTPAGAPLRHKITVHPVTASSFCAWPTSIPGTSVMEFLNFIRGKRLFQFAYKFEKFLPLLLEEMNRNVFQFNMISSFIVGFFGAPGKKIFCLGNCFGLRFVIIVAHGDILGSD